LARDSLTQLQRSKPADLKIVAVLRLA
jgi:hypothetical protein